MFRFLVAQLNANMLELSELHPSILEALLERCWNLQANVAAAPLGHPQHRSDVPGRPDQLINPVLAFNPRRRLGAAATIPVVQLDQDIQSFAVPNGLRWQHLIYAYMIENTRVVDVFRRAIDMFLHGERLSTIPVDAQRWLWTTEELFFRDPPSWSIGTQTSWIRPRPELTRGTAYQRMFNMTLNAAAAGDKPGADTTDQANADFVSALDELLHEIWQGRTNFANAVGARPTDDSKIAELATRLCDMLRARRMEGTLSREEFWAVSMMSWFHATLATTDHPIVVALRAEARSAEEVLFKIAQRVGHPAHGLSKSFFEIAEPLSRLLIAIEEGTYNAVNAVPALYDPSLGGAAADTDLIKTHWSIIRGRDVKAKKVYANA